MEDQNEHLLLKPSAKKTRGLKREYPFPIISNDAVKENSSDPEWKCAEGYLQDNYVLVHDEKSIQILYTRGFYGKGTLSKHGPEICYKKPSLEDKCSSAISDHHIKKCERKQKKTQSSMPTKESVDELIICVEDSLDECYESNKPDDEEIEVVLSDSDATQDEKDSRNEEESIQKSNPEKESLQLTFEEAYFLSYGLGCLLVKDKNQPLNLTRLWSMFCELSGERNFPAMYAAYHHLRSKGWIVRNGLKYGVDYILYKDGPPYYHSTYSVIVKPVKEKGLRDLAGNQQFTWSSLAALNRVTTTVGKGLMFLYVIKPSQITEMKIITPYCISQYKIEEVLVKRWVPSASRKDTE